MVTLFENEDVLVSLEKCCTVTLSDFPLDLFFQFRGLHRYFKLSFQFSYVHVIVSELRPSFSVLTALLSGDFHLKKN